MGTTIRVRCTDQVLTYENTPTIASGGRQEDFVAFEFCSRWDGFVRTAVFWRTEAEAYHVLLDDADTCEIPREVLQKDGVIYFGVFGVNAEQRQRTTETLTYKIVKGAITEGTKPSDPTPDIYTQLQAAYAAVLANIAEYQADTERLMAMHLNEMEGIVEGYHADNAKYMAAHEQAVAEAMATHETTVAQEMAAHEQAVANQIGDIIKAANAATAAANVATAAAVNKTDKVAGATAGNLAGLTEDGDLVDSGIGRDYLLTEENAGKMGLTGNDATVDKALGYLRDMIFQGFGGAVVEVTLQGADGTPIPNAELTGVTTLSGGVAVTDAEGKVTVKSPRANPAIGWGQDFADIVTGSQTVACALEERVAVTLTVETVDFAAFTESTVVKISPLCTRLDVSACGGGGRGASGDARSSSIRGGSGGRGGNVAVQEGVEFTPGEKYPLLVGAGGVYNIVGPGGTSAFLGVEAPGGASGGGGTGAIAYFDGDEVSAKVGADGTESIFASLTEMELCGGDGGGGGAYYKSAGGVVSNPSSGKAGGAPHGGKGGNTGNNQGGDEGTQPGGGGGGGASRLDETTGDKTTWYGSNGGHGKVALRMWHGNEEAAA